MRDSITARSRNYDYGDTQRQPHCGSWSAFAPARQAAIATAKQFPT
ncbi:hypothetical protein HYU12_03005 [Candidatus Woesearchaeota archaeon]|nr:hypothetical protein [Candidatus Woesearchaeota archaeon]